MLSKQKSSHLLIFLILTNLALVGCTSPKSPEPEILYSTHCGSCHIAPDINSLPKPIWEKNILPDMAARMGIKEGNYKPYEGLSYDEMEAVMKTGIYNTKPLMTTENWVRLRDYILTMAPDTLTPLPDIAHHPLTGFEEKPLSLDTIPGSKNITYLSYDEEKNNLIYGDLMGEVNKYNWNDNTSERQALFTNPVVSYSDPAGEYALTIGQLHPTQIHYGQLYQKKETTYEPVGGFLHRPVHMLVEDLDGDGNQEIIISEFGDLLGELSFYETKGERAFQKRILSNLPGTIRVIGRDMNGDGKTDLVALTSQGDEGITIFYQEKPLEFRAERVLRFSPVYGTSWFDLLDYDGDGDQDLITVNGDNADKSFVLKPYHGFRIHLNNGKNEFSEAFFYPLHGATRVLGRDFDQDGDIDFCLLATFPDYNKDPLIPFVYLKNEDPDTFSFNSQVLENPSAGRWLLLESGDIDRDGDEDIIMSPFTYIFIPVPEKLNAIWNSSSADLLVLENKLIDDD